MKAGNSLRGILKDTTCVHANMGYLLLSHTIGLSHQYFIRDSKSIVQRFDHSF